ncbi:HupE/UreJ family protein [Myxosarcina sp. GI1]|uniref:HupE/UreJ family protein n=1 Tax=Myxosarcina sp. GI1 TaxID=1541065 RepID=UPI00055B7DFE|nr:HupE/UreJ family protein [Myxosarcina sp. GI1]
MSQIIKVTKIKNLQFQSFPRIKTLVILFGAFFLLNATPADAHHAMGGMTPQNFWQGFLSGIAHPIIGIDHFAFIIAVGLLAALTKQGLFIPVGFILASLAGTVIHLFGLNLPAPELFISASVLIFGAAIALKNRPSLIWTVSLAAIAGVFHGYAYGESIIGAEMTPLVAYMAGFAIIQLAIASLAFYITKSLVRSKTELPLRFAGLAILGTGIAFFSSAVLR